MRHHARPPLPRHHRPTRTATRLLRAPTRHRVIAGVTVLDILPPDLNRAESLMERAVELSKRDLSTDGMAELRRRGMVRRGDLVAMGCTVPRAPAVGEWLFDPDR